MIPSIQIVVRHSADCPSKDKGEDFRRCTCRKSVRWTDPETGKQRRESAGTRSWEGAEQYRRKIEDAYRSGGKREERATVATAIELFLASKENLSDHLFKKHQRELARLQAFCKDKGVRYISAVNLPLLTEFRKGWRDLYPSIRTQRNALTRMRQFLRYCVNCNWLSGVPELEPIRIELKAITEEQVFTSAQYATLLATIPVEFPYAVKAGRVRGLLQCMRHTGLAIGDTVRLEREQISRSETGIYRVKTTRKKTGQVVYVPIPAAVAEELLKVANGNPQYVFWSTGTPDKAEVAVKNWQRDLRRLFVAAGLPHAHSHMLRHTYITDMLSRGIPIEEVAKLAGHKNSAITAAVYAHWTKERQERLDRLVAATWEQPETTSVVKSGSARVQ